MRMTYIYTPTILHKLAGKEKDAYIDFYLKAHRSYFYKELEHSIEHIAKELTVEPPQSHFKHSVLVWDQDKVIAWGEFRYQNDEKQTNSEYCEVDMKVDPQYLRQGIGSELMKQFVSLAEEHQKSMVEIWANSYALDGVVPKLLDNLGMKKAVEESCNRLRREHINRDLLAKLPQYEEKLAQYHFQNLSRDEYLIKIIDDEAFRTESAEFLTEIVNLVPKGDSERADEKYTASDLLARAKSDINNPKDGTFLLLWDKDKLIGYSATRFPKGDVRAVNTGLTGVRKKYQRQGIAMYLKLLMVKHYLQFDDFQYIDTENAHTNVGMLKINEKLGFRTEFQWLWYEGKVAEIKTRLQKKM